MCVCVLGGGGVLTHEDIRGRAALTCYFFTKNPFNKNTIKNGSLFQNFRVFALKHSEKYLKIVKNLYLFETNDS